jgi:biopolymer transport protein ExbD
MEIHLECTHCGKKLAAPAERAGKRARCPACQEMLVVPTTDALEAPIASRRVEEASLSSVPAGATEFSRGRQPAENEGQQPQEPPSADGESHAFLRRRSAASLDGGNGTAGWRPSRRAGTPRQSMGNATLNGASEERPSQTAKRPPSRPLLPPTTDAPDHDLIDMTAMVDIVFFLLIFFMVTSMHAMQASISLPTPEAKPDSAGAVRVAAAADDQVVVQIDADDTVAVDGEEVPSRQELITRLRDSERENLLVLASGDAMHGTVVMVLDAGSDAGMEQIRLVSEGLESD